MSKLNFDDLFDCLVSLGCTAVHLVYFDGQWCIERAGRVRPSLDVDDEKGDVEE